MTSETSFVENVLKAFKNINKEIEKDSVEHDIRPRFVKYFIELVLGYTGSHYRYEKKRTDITIFDENNFAVIKIETKKPTESIDKKDHEEQAFKYEEETTRFIGLTNFLQFKLWEVKKTGSELRLNLDFSKILEQREPTESLSSEEKSQILFLNNLTKEALFNPSKYDKFDETYARIDITKDAGFRKLLDRLNFIADNSLLGYTLRAFGEYKEGYSKYQNELKELSEVPRDEKNGYTLAKYKQKIEDEYSKYKAFGGYYLWKEYSGKGQVSDDDVKEVFCKESIYVLLNKLLFIRICEDKSLLEKNLSNGGIEELRPMLKKRFEKDIINRELLEIAFKSARTLYAHFYETGILDWFRTGDGGLNELLNRVLWVLNQFDFTHVDRDILGNLYEKYLPSRERKRLGEFYTPTEVIDYILTSVGYTYSYDIETKDLLDPACGSGGFLVRASRRLISRYLMKFRKTDKKELRDPKNWKEIVKKLSPDEAKIILEALQEHIYGLDINPFACHIAEMNILFQVIDLYQKTKEKYPDFTLKRFKIYQTDSLELPRQKAINDFGGNHLRFLQEREEIDAIKNKKFDFVVGNPPWGGILKREKGSMLAERLKQDYVSAVGKYDIYVLFIERGINWLKECGRFGYIVQNRFLRVDYGKKLREFLLENVKIDKIVDFGDTKVFADATNYPAIIIFERKPVKDSELVYIEVRPKANELSSQKIIDYVKSYSPKSKDYLSIIKINQQKLKTLNAWLPSQIVIDSIISKVKNIKHLKELTEEIMEGVTFGGTGADNIFVIDSNIIKSFRIESKLYKKMLKGRDIRKWNLEWDHRYLFYPYDSKGNELNITEYPNGYEYIKQHYDSLSKRILDGKKITEWGKQWFSFWRARNPEVFTKQKILSPRIATNNSFTLDSNGEFYLTDSAVAIVPKDIEIKYLLGVLNSNLLFYIVKNTSPFVQGRYYSYTRTYLDNLPIKLPETAQEKRIVEQIIKKVDEILEIHELGVVDIDAILEGEEIDKLHQLPKVTFSISDNAKFEKVKVDNSKIYINSRDFIEIKDKKIRDFVEVYLNFNSEKFAKAKDVKNIILNISIPKSDDVSKEITEKGGADQTQIKEKIKILENEVNELVYQIYGITQSERKTIEANL